MGKFENKRNSSTKTTSDKIHEFKLHTNLNIKIKQKDYQFLLPIINKTQTLKLNKTCIKLDPNHKAMLNLIIQISCYLFLLKTCRTITLPFLKILQKDMEQLTHSTVTHNYSCRKYIHTNSAQWLL